jgi:shikimate kinase
VNRIFLSGFSGTGKSTVGALLAEKHRVGFADLDLEIEKHSGLAIDEIFCRFGEDYFRQLETKVLQSLKARVVALGGGTVTICENVYFMRENGVTALLIAAPGELEKRLAASYGRPKLAGEAQISKIKRLLFSRVAYYTSSADFAVDTTALSPSTVGKIVWEKAAILFS